MYVYMFEFLKKYYRCTSIPITWATNTVEKKNKKRRPENKEKYNTFWYVT